MYIYKFGGTSVGSPEGMRRVADIIDDGEPKIIVLSALSGITNRLSDIALAIRNGRLEEARATWAAMKEIYDAFCDQLLDRQSLRAAALEAVERSQSLIAEKISEADGSPQAEKEILAQGELVSTRIFQLFLNQRNCRAALLPALQFMRTDPANEPDLQHIRSALPKVLQAAGTTSYYITQGYICRNAEGAVDNLQRGGSDYTATLIGAALGSEEIQIWTDIDGLHNNDPRIVEGTFPIRQLSYREAAELAYFGAKILHPTCVIPAEKQQIPIRLKNTFQPEAQGTLISSIASGSGIAAIAAKDGITAIRIRSSRMLNAYGFLRRVFQVFEDFRTPIDMITTSEVAVSLTIDNDSQLPDILHQLGDFGEVSAESDQTIICLVGDQLGHRRGYAKRIFSALAEVPIRAVSYGGSNNNVTLLVDRQFKEEALRALNRGLFPTTL